MDIFVGNLPPQATEQELLDLFKTFGQVGTVEIKRDLFSGASKGFAFVEMPGRNHSLAAITGLNGQLLHGQPIKVNESRPKTGGFRRR